jgi:hypothetical protein
VIAAVVVFEVQACKIDGPAIFNRKYVAYTYAGYSGYLRELLL